MKHKIALLAAVAIGLSGCAPLAGVVLQAAVGDDIKAALKPHMDKLKSSPCDLRDTETGLCLPADTKTVAITEEPSPAKKIQTTKKGKKS